MEPQLPKDLRFDRNDLGLVMQQPGSRQAEFFSQAHQQAVCRELLLRRPRAADIDHDNSSNPARTHQLNECAA